MPLQLDDVATIVGLSMKAALAPVAADLAAARAELAFLSGAAVTLRERLAVVEAREPVPGPPGAKGQDGKDGEPGPPGDPGLRHKKIWQKDLPANETHYNVGDLVIDDGSTYFCLERTHRTTKPGTSPAWIIWAKSAKQK